MEDDNSDLLLGDDYQDLMDWGQSIKTSASLKSVNFKDLTIEEFMQEQNIESMEQILKDKDLREVFLKDMREVLFREKQDVKTIESYIRKLRNK